MFEDEPENEESRVSRTEESKASVESPIHKIQTIQKNFSETEIPNKRNLSVDVAYRDKTAQHNNGVKYLLVAVDVLSRYLRVQPMKALYAKDAVEAFKKMIKRKKPERVWTDKGSEFKGEFKTFSEKKEIHLNIQPKTKPSRHLLRGIFDRSKISFTITWRKNRLGLILRNCPSL